MPVFALPNIFTHKNLRYYIAVPLVLLVVGLVLSTQLTLDTSLSGGINLVIQTNATINSQQLASHISSALKVASPSVFASPGTLQITIPNNQSLVAAENYQLNFYAQLSNYTALNLNTTSLQNAIHSNPGNQTLLSQLSASASAQNATLLGMKSQLDKELTSLTPFIGSVKYNPGDVNNMTAVAQNAYSNANNAYHQKVLSTMHSLVPFTTYSLQDVGPTLGRFFLGQVEDVIIGAFVLISIAVFLIFRSWAPSLAIIFGAGNDIIIALGAMVVLNIPLGLASVGGLLMLIGYAIDTEMITAVRILKRKEGTPEERAYGAMKTGLTMTIAAIISFGMLFIVSLVEYVPTFYQISGVVLFGLIADIITTWLGNAPLILMYKKRHERV
ncbi:MAG: hypothetical protein KGH49_01485 [Candidatus Micrarchaeota archaeon]|nr:hypothetical protein [Candidatus Micrarchaeota archaeon]